MSQAKLTLPLIHTLEKLNPVQRRTVLAKLKKAKRAGKKGRVVDLKDVIELVRHNDGISYAQSVAADYARKASEALKKLAHYAAERNK